MVIFRIIYALFLSTLLFESGTHGAISSFGFRGGGLSSYRFGSSRIGRIGSYSYRGGSRYNYGNRNSYRYGYRSSYRNSYRYGYRYGYRYSSRGYGSRYYRYGYYYSNGHRYKCDCDDDWGSKYKENHDCYKYCYEYY